MKKIILALALAAFSFTAYAEGTDSACIDVGQSLSADAPISEILDSLIAPACGMSLQDAVGAIIADGGNQKDTLAAAMIVDPNFSYIDPTAGLDPTAAGHEDDNEDNGDNRHEGDNREGGHGEHTTGGGGGASPA